MDGPNCPALKMFSIFYFFYIIICIIYYLAINNAINSPGSINNPARQMSRGLTGFVGFDHAPRVSPFATALHLSPVFAFAWVFLRLKVHAHCPHTIAFFHPGRRARRRLRETIFDPCGLIFGYYFILCDTNKNFAL
jgi:hypothetical protein